MPRGGWLSIHSDTACDALYTLNANQVMKYPIWAHLAFRAPWLRLEGRWPPGTETHWPEIWLETQRPSYITSFAAPGLNLPICFLFLRAILVSFLLLHPWTIRQYWESMGPLRLWYILSTYFLVYDHSYVILIPVPLILQTLFHWPLWISHSSRNTS